MVLQTGSDIGKPTVYGCANKGSRLTGYVVAEIQQGYGAPGGTESTRGRGLFVICTKV